MTTWRISDGAGHWLTWADRGWSADPATTEAVAEVQRAGHALPLTPTGPGYPVTDPLDEISAWLIASLAIPRGLVEGEGPELPIPDDDGTTIF